MLNTPNTRSATPAEVAEFYQGVKQNSPTCDAESHSGRFGCTRNQDHQGEHVALAFGSYDDDGAEMFAADTWGNGATTPET